MALRPGTFGGVVQVCIITLIVLLFFIIIIVILFLLYLSAVELATSCACCPRGPVVCGCALVEGVVRAVLTQCYKRCGRG